MEETINWLDSGIVCAARQERRKEGMPPGMFGSLKYSLRETKISIKYYRLHCYFHIFPGNA